MDSISTVGTKYESINQGDKMGYYQELDSALGAEQEVIENEIPYMRDRYTVANSASVGSGIQCPYCGVSLKKRTYQHKFCNSSCKDHYWNLVDDDRRERSRRY